MIKPCYSDYVRHALRYYTRYPRPRFKTETDRANWNACHNVLTKYSERDKEILVYVYGAFDTIADNVYAMANKFHIHQNIIWDTMRNLEKEIAIERGLWE